MKHRNSLNQLVHCQRNPVIPLAPRPHLSPPGRGENKNSFSRRTSARGLPTTTTTKLFLIRFPHRARSCARKRGAERRKAHPTNVRATQSDVAV